MSPQSCWLPDVRLTVCALVCLLCCLRLLVVLRVRATANNDLGTACGKFFRCSVMAVTDQGDSDLITSLQAQQ